MGSAGCDRLKDGVSQPQSFPLISISSFTLLFHSLFLVSMGDAYDSMITVTGVATCCIKKLQNIISSRCDAIWCYFPPCECVFIFVILLTRYGSLFIQELRRLGNSVQLPKIDPCFLSVEFWSPSWVSEFSYSLTFSKLLRDILEHDRSRKQIKK